MRGMGCMVRIYADAKPVADLWRSEKVVMYLQEGDHIISASTCGGGVVDPANFAELHVFHADLPVIFDDWVERLAYADRLAATIAEFDLACDNVPPEWWWVDNGVPASFDRDSAREILGRFNDDNFWRVA